MSNSNVEIKVIGSRQEYASLDSQDEARIVAVIRENVLPRSNAEYYRVDVKVKRRRDQTPQYLVAYLLRRDIYLAEVVKVDVDRDFQVNDITENYEDSDDEDEEDSNDDYTDENTLGEAELGAYTVDFVAATPVPDIPTAKAAVLFLHDLATKAGLTSKVLLGNEATIANYKLYLSSGLKGFVNIGHGNPSGIALADGMLPASWFQSLVGNPLRPGVIYFNSCQVHNDPLKSAVISAGARTFIGGIVNLLIGPSEEVCQCFWSKILPPATNPMGPTLKQCEKEKYPNEGAHGISGDTGPFTILNLKLVQALWTHGHSMQIEYPDRLVLTQRVGPFIRVRGKPFTSNWFHFAIPTSVILNAKRLLVGSVMVRFRTGPGAEVYAVHIYDGETRIAAHDELKLAPQSSFVYPRFDVPSHPPVKWGIGISIGVKFGDDANLPENKLIIEFSSAGCDFVEKI